MSDAVFNTIQLGQQSVHGTPVAASVIYPADAGAIIELDRATTSPEEDYGDISRHHSGRSYHGVRAAQLPLASEARFEDLPEVLEMHVEGGVVPTGAGPYVWIYDFDETADTLKRYTVEAGTNETEDQWEISDCLATDLELGFDALTVPGASPWKVSASLLGKDRVQAALTGALSAPAVLETMLGHNTTLLEGTTATAFAALGALPASLAQFRMRSALNLGRRVYGGSADTFSAYGRGRGVIEFDAMVKISATSKTNIHDIWNVAGAVPTERRWRINVAGSGTKVMTIDFRPVFTAVPIGDRDGERLYSLSGYFVKDATLASRGRITITNSVATLPS
jgi:hypothetical protein